MSGTVLTEEEWIKQTGATVIEGEATMPLRMIFCLPFEDAAPLSTWTCIHLNMKLCSCCFTALLSNGRLLFGAC
jgi:hypothetical protein